MFKFNLKYFLFAITLFIVEVLIALYVRDSIIRPYGGDYLVVMLIYCSVRSFINIRPIKLAIAVLLFSYCIETLQYFKLIDRIGLADNEIAKTVIGYGFSWLDILAYTLGIITILLLHLIFPKHTPARK